MALQDLNTFKDLAREWNGVTVETVRRWFKRWGPLFKLKVKRPSERAILVTRSEAERFWLLVEAQWDSEPEFPAVPQDKPKAKRKRSRRQKTRPRK